MTDAGTLSGLGRFAADNGELVAYFLGLLAIVSWLVLSVRRSKVRGSEEIGDAPVILRGLPTAGSVALYLVFPVLSCGTLLLASVADPKGGLVPIAVIIALLSLAALWWFRTNRLILTTEGISLRPNFRRQTYSWNEVRGIEIMSLGRKHRKSTLPVMLITQGRPGIPLSGYRFLTARNEKILETVNAYARGNDADLPPDIEPLSFGKFHAS